MLDDADLLASRFSAETLRGVRSLSLGRVVTRLADIRNGFILTGGDSLYTDEKTERMASSWLQWIAWSPQAFTTVLGAPYPWQWRKEGRVDPTRVAMWIESLVLILLLPFILVGCWRLVRAWSAEGLTLVLFFFLFGTVLGLTVVNVGTLVRLRLPVILIALALGAVGLASRRWRISRAAGAGG